MNNIMQEVYSINSCHLKKTIIINCHFNICIYIKCEMFPLINQQCFGSIFAFWLNQKVGL